MAGESLCSAALQRLSELNVRKESDFGIYDINEKGREVVRWGGKRLATVFFAKKGTEALRAVASTFSSSIKLTEQYDKKRQMAKRPVALDKTSELRSGRLYSNEGGEDYPGQIRKITKIIA